MVSSLIARVMLLMVFLCFAALSACTVNQAEELFKTAEFEELQNNREHALQLYSDIIKKYPQSEYAAKAEARVSEMGESGK